MFGVCVALGWTVDTCTCVGFGGFLDEFHTISLCAPCFWQSFAQCLHRPRYTGNSEFLGDYELLVTGSCLSRPREVQESVFFGRRLPELFPHSWFDSRYMVMLGYGDA